MNRLSNWDLLNLFDHLPAHEYLALTSTCAHLHSLKNEKTTQKKREKSKTYIKIKDGGRRGYTNKYYILPNGEIDGLHILISYDDYRTTETTYVNGKRHGTCQVYENDVLVKQGEYVNDMKEGVWEDFYEGDVCGYVNYHHGKKDGIHEYWMSYDDNDEHDWVTDYYNEGVLIDNSD